VTRSGPLIVEPGAGFSPVYSLINGARHSIDMTMYEFSDAAAERALRRNMTGSSYRGPRTAAWSPPQLPSPGKVSQ